MFSILYIKYLCYGETENNVFVSEQWNNFEIKK